MQYTGCPKKMSFSEKEAYLAKGHFFWDTWYLLWSPYKIACMHKFVHPYLLNIQSLDPGREHERD